MKLTNATNYQTADLRAIVAKVASDELADFPRRRLALRVEVVHTHGAGGSLSGVAWERSCRVRLRIPRTNVNPVMFAWLAAHEIAHVRGMGHRKMPAYLNNWTATSRERWGWAAAFPVRQQAPAVKSVLAAREAAVAHAAAMLRKAETRKRRADTILAKWRGKMNRAAARLRAARNDEPLRTDGGLSLELPAAGSAKPEEK